MPRPNKSNPALEASIALARELFAGLGDIQVRKMFGGAGVYYSGRMFALIADTEIYLKADRHNQADFDAHDCPYFHYDKGSGEVMTMSYRAMPLIGLDDPEEALHWARRGIEAALRAKP